MVTLTFAALFFLAGVLVTPVGFLLAALFAVVDLLDGLDSEWVALYRIVRAFVVGKGN